MQRQRQCRVRQASQGQGRGEAVAVAGQWRAHKEGASRHAARTAGCTRGQAAGRRGCLWLLTSPWKALRPPGMPAGSAAQRSLWVGVLNTARRTGCSAAAVPGTGAAAAHTCVLRSVVPAYCHLQAAIVRVWLESLNLCNKGLGVGWISIGAHEAAAPLCGRQAGRNGGERLMSEWWLSAL